MLGVFNRSPVGIMGVSKADKTLYIQIITVPRGDKSISVGSFFFLNVSCVAFIGRHDQPHFLFVCLSVTTFCLSVCRLLGNLYVQQFNVAFWFFRRLSHRC